MDPQPEDRPQAFMSDYINRIFKKDREWDRSRNFCDLMATKVINKLRRLPQTNVWLLHYS